MKKIVLSLLLFSQFVLCQSKSSDSLMDDFEAGIVKSYVNALDSFATVMPYIGGDTESELNGASLNTVATFSYASL